MGKIIKIDIERGSNKGFVVKYYKGGKPSAFQSLAGMTQEIETLAFQNEKDLAEWIGKVE
jgi:hypothetical protein